LRSYISSQHAVFLINMGCVQAWSAHGDLWWRNFVSFSGTCRLTLDEKLHGFQRHFPSGKSSPDKFSFWNLQNYFTPTGWRCHNFTRHCALPNHTVHAIEIVFFLSFFLLLSSCFVLSVWFKIGYRFTFGEYMQQEVAGFGGTNCFLCGFCLSTIKTFIILFHPFDIFANFSIMFSRILKLKFCRWSFAGGEWSWKTRFSG
jgi:hypothetical protein